jgi:hypothetical protein
MKCACRWTDLEGVLRTEVRDLDATIQSFGSRGIETLEFNHLKKIDDNLLNAHCCYYLIGLLLFKERKCHVIPLVAGDSPTSIEDTLEKIDYLFREEVPSFEKYSLNVSVGEPIYLDDYIATLSKKIEYPGRSTWSFNRWPRIGLQLTYYYTSSPKITFLRRLEVMGDLWRSSIQTNLGVLFKDIFEELCILQRLRNSPLGRFFSHLSTSVEMEMTNRKTWHRWLDSCAEIDISMIEPHEFKVFRKVGDTLVKEIAKGGLKWKPKSIRLTPYMKVDTSSWNNFHFVFMSKIRMGSIEQTVHLLRIIGKYEEVADACSKYILSSV